MIRLNSIRRFEETGVEWLLQQRPVGLLDSLEELVTHLGSQLTREGSKKVFGKGRNKENDEEKDQPIKQLPVLTRVLGKIIWYVCVCVYLCVYNSCNFNTPGDLITMSLELIQRN